MTTIDKSQATCTLYAAIAGFQWHRAGAGDTGCYTVREAEQAGLAVGEGG